MTFTFTDRNSYFEYKAAWKDRLAEKIKELRKTKRDYCEYQRASNKSKAYTAFWRIAELKRELHDMFTEREMSKIEAGLQMTARFKR